ncbi:MAG: S-methyl-5'-thioadenosine phosphorylase [Halobacteriovoraceae bacterium]|nr:S-methyl-5'-thioadenosine phosphorylase [Halobacteriovoraceae bacterium]
MDKSNLKIGIIGGSGIYSMDSISIIEQIDKDTPFGKPSGPVIKAQLKDAELYFIARHGSGHTLLPHEINYRANIYALKSMGIKYIISITAVGSLQEQYPPGTFVLPGQYIDWTKGKRERTFFGNGIVAHVSTANPIESQLQKIIFDFCRENSFTCHRGGTYICIEGPQFSSKAESNLYRSMGADIIGMTNLPEAYLAKEAGIAYASLAMVTDYDCWRDKDACVEDILKVMKETAKKAQHIIKGSILKIIENPFNYPKENHLGLMTPIENLNPTQKEIATVIFDL